MAIKTRIILFTISHFILCLAWALQIGSQMNSTQLEQSCTNGRRLQSSDFATAREFQSYTDLCQRAAKTASPVAPRIAPAPTSNPGAPTFSPSSSPSGTASAVAPTNRESAPSSNVPQNSISNTSETPPSTPSTPTSQNGVRVKNMNNSFQPPSSPSSLDTYAPAQTIFNNETVIFRPDKNHYEMESLINSRNSNLKRKQKLIPNSLSGINPNAIVPSSTPVAKKIESKALITQVKKETTLPDFFMIDEPEKDNQIKCQKTLDEGDVSTIDKKFSAECCHYLWGHIQTTFLSKDELLNINKSAEGKISTVAMTSYLTMGAEIEAILKKIKSSSYLFLADGKSTAQDFQLLAEFLNVTGKLLSPEKVSQIQKSILSEWGNSNKVNYMHAQYLKNLQSEYLGAKIFYANKKTDLKLEEGLKDKTQKYLTMMNKLKNLCQKSYALNQ